ncbi:response regulator [Nevskia ramosa]|uniref:response regulator n=1 Tax=Nevskia ramosa TaxID=64002 RepID=UPI0003B37769|nr:response regulator transcription factor [Nevskia ramosa]
MNGQTHVFLIDDHHVLRQAIARMLDQETDITVVGQAGDAQSGIAMMETLLPYPEIIVIDLKMPGQSGMSAIAEIMAAHPETRIIVFTMYDNPGYVWSTMNAGARGYLLKSASGNDLLRAVRSVAHGGAYLQAEITMPLLKRLVQDARTADDRGALSVREMHILEALADGLSNKMIAKTLSITEETVKSHLKKIYEKLGAADRAHAVAIALRQQLIG